MTILTILKNNTDFSKYLSEFCLLFEDEKEKKKQTKSTKKRETLNLFCLFSSFHWKYNNKTPASLSNQSKKKIKNQNTVFRKQKQRKKMNRKKRENKLKGTYTHRKNK